MSQVFLRGRADKVVLDSEGAKKVIVARRSLVVVLLMMLFTAACGADGDAETAPSVTNSPATTQTSSQTDSSAGDPTPPPESEIDETTTTRDPGAGGAVDLGYLVLGPGTRFVPLDDPVMIPALEVTWLAPDSIVLGVVHPSGEVQAFAADMMAYHHIANTTIAGEPYLVTY